MESNFNKYVTALIADDIAWSLMKSDISALFMTNINIHDIKHTSDGSRLETPTVANEIELTLAQSSIYNIPATICPKP